MLNGKSKSKSLNPAVATSAAVTPAAGSSCLKALAELLKAYEYARSGQREVWDFAVEIRTLRETGLSNSDFRWLACAGHLDHACEVTILGDDERHFQRTGKLSFARRTCFVLTDSGAQYARSQLNGRAPSLPAPPPLAAHPVVRSKPLLPVWDPERRELRIGGTLVKQFKWPAVNQEMILAVFQEMKWPARIDDPLPPQPEQDSKRRLHDTIKCLNRNQKQKLIRFYGDGTGEGVLWKLQE